MIHAPPPPLFVDYTLSNWTTKKKFNCLPSALASLWKEHGAGLLRLRVAPWHLHYVRMKEKDEGGGTSLCLVDLAVMASNLYLLSSSLWPLYHKHAYPPLPPFPPYPHSPYELVWVGGCLAASISCPACAYVWRPRSRVAVANYVGSKHTSAHAVPHGRHGMAGQGRAEQGSEPVSRVGAYAFMFLYFIFLFVCFFSQ